MRTTVLKIAVLPLLLAACDAGSKNASSSHGSSSSSGGGGATTTVSSNAASSNTASSSSGVGGATGTTSSSSSASSSGTGAGGSIPGWTLVWNDEFNGPDGSDVDSTKWVHEVSGTGNGNQELEYYTAGTANAYQSGGYLHIIAKAGSGGNTCWNGPCQYTSGKITTKSWGKPSLFEHQYGRFAARMKIPAGQGMWPAFWLLGNDISTVNWPTCGEIDTMENIGKNPATVYGTIHGPDAAKNNISLGGNSMLPMGALADDFHEYAIEWKAGQVAFLLDGTVYFTATQSAFMGTWVFDHPYYLILNLAIGGTWPGSPDANTVFPAELLVDWVRVYDPGP
jgi:beta-glucanase (GH16 family)